MELTKERILETVEHFVPFTKSGTPKISWFTIIEGKILPARQLILRAKGVPPNDSMNTYQAVDILKHFGFPVYFKGRKV